MIKMNRREWLKAYTRMYDDVKLENDTTYRDYFKISSLKWNHDYPLNPYVEIKFSDTECETLFMLKYFNTPEEYL